MQQEKELAPKPDYQLHTDRMWMIKAKMYDLLEVGFGSLEWIAAQEDENKEYWGICCVLRGVFEFDKSKHGDYVDFFVLKEDFAIKTDAELANEFAEHILGYPVGSQQDIDRKKRYITERIKDCDAEIDQVVERRRTWKLKLWALGEQ